MIQLQIFVMNFCNFTPIESEFNSSKPCLQGWSLILEKGYKNPRSLLTSYTYRIHDILALFLQPFVYLIAVIGSYFVSPCGCDKYVNLLHPKRWDFNLIRYILAGGSHFFFYLLQVDGYYFICRLSLIRGSDSKLVAHGRLASAIKKQGLWQQQKLMLHMAMKQLFAG